MRGSMTHHVSTRPPLKPTLHAPSEITPTREHVYLSERGMRWTHIEDGLRSIPMRVSILECIVTSGITALTSAITYLTVKSGALGPRVRRFTARDQLRTVPSFMRDVDSYVSEHPENAPIARSIWEGYLKKEGLPSPDPIPGERQQASLDPVQPSGRRRQTCRNPVQPPKRRPCREITKH
jgi:hypothetical protein